MTKIILLFLFVSLSSFAQEVAPNPNGDITNADTPVVNTEIPQTQRKMNHRQSHWITNFGFEGLKYDVPYNFRGARNNFSKNEHELWGGRLSTGRQFYLGGNLHTTTKAGGFFLGTLYQRVLNGGPDDPEAEAAYTKRTGGIYGIDVSQTVAKMFDFKTKNPFLGDVSYLVFEPYIEGGIGMARAYNYVNYHYDTGDASGTGQVQEDYRHRINDELTYTKFGAGFNITSDNGFFFYMNATVNNFIITKRKERVFTKQDDQTGDSNPDSDTNVTMTSFVYGLGGGYKF